MIADEIFYVPNHRNWNYYSVKFYFHVILFYALTNTGRRRFELLPRVLETHVLPLNYLTDWQTTLKRDFLLAKYLLVSLVALGPNLLSVSCEPVSKAQEIPNLIRMHPKDLFLFAAID